MFETIPSSITAVVLVLLAVSVISLIWTLIKKNTTIVKDVDNFVTKHMDIFNKIREDFIHIVTTANTLYDVNQEGGKEAVDNYIQKEYVKYINENTKLSAVEKSILLRIDVANLIDLIGDFLDNKSEDKTITEKVSEESVVDIEGTVEAK